MNKIPESKILIIFGASGDLTHRKLIPSLFELFERKLLPDKFLIVGVSRTKQSTEEFRWRRPPCRLPETGPDTIVLNADSFLRQNT